MEKEKSLISALDTLTSVGLSSCSSTISTLKTKFFIPYPFF